MIDPTKVVNLQDKLAQFSKQWSPHIVAGYNGNDVMVVKIEGDFNWHSHPETDDFFHVLSGILDIELRDGNGERTVTLHPGELYVVPRGLEHRPRARQGEVHILLVEPAGTPNTGDPATAVVKQYI